VSVWHHANFNQRRFTSRLDGRYVACAILASALYLRVPLLSVSSQPTDSTDVTSWSGVWEGTSLRIPAGSCVGGGLQKPLTTRLVL